MLPSEFYTRYGHPITRTVMFADMNDRVIRGNDNRYLLGFWYTPGSVLLIPAIDNPSIYTGGNFDLNKPAIILTHALHGALVNMDWIVRYVAGALPFPLLVIEGFMGTNKPCRKRKRNA